MSSPINYFKEAFFTFWNYCTLAGLFALGIPVRFHYYYLFFALAVETGMLLTISTNKRFRRAIRSRRLSGMDLPDSSEHAGIRRNLDPEHQERLKKFDNICDQIKGNAEMIDSPRSALLGVSLSKMDHLVNTYLQMLIAHQSYSKYLAQVDRDRIVRNLETLKLEVETRTDRVAELKRKNIDILLQRLDRIDKARDQIEVLEAELDVMMNTVHLLRDQTVSISDPQGISQQIDTVLENMRDAESLVKEMDAFMNIESTTPVEEFPTNTTG